MLHLFEEALAEGNIYPCTLSDISQVLDRLPSKYLEELNGVGFTPSSRYHKNANAIYDYKSHTIIIYPYPSSLRYKQPRHISFSDAINCMHIEIAFGMRVEKHGARVECVWEADNLKRFILCHVLLHELGHHVYYLQRKNDGYRYEPITHVHEQFAEDFALRLRRELQSSMKRLQG